ncbi:GNAT family N-acetyltransferase [Aeromicrobium yanjiei]|uniref:GNAT family N-acetyltransferase n=1 Tax=Aeromicrobium yanjiei TaxID=2662028 RepID=A0A5Q2MJU0_9ACTN|nr:GNAT family N-acetyltransferase [Aeromicrobium yanjiei]QGG41302.1 GNAT family N-acetyltransferase [Aeromicrobium yanjiei]
MIRQLGPDDWAVWRALRGRSLSEDRAAFSASTTMWTGDDDTEERWRGRVADGPCFIAYEDEQPVGMVAGQLAGETASLTSMWVAPEVRGRGVGAELVSAVVRWAAGRELSLRVIDGNTAAVSTYEAAGFVLQDGVDDEGCRRMVRPTLPHRLVQPPAASATVAWLRRARRVGLRGVLADLNRSGRHVDVPAEAAAYGMAWQRTDEDTQRWFPQGITTSADAYGPEPSGGTYEGHDVVLASWYGHGRIGRRLGARISVIDWHDDEPPRYRHVLLVEPRRLGPLHRLRRVRVHAGGIVWYGDHLFVAGSSAGLRVFRLDDVVRVRNRLRTGGYRYVLPQRTVYAAEHDGDAGPMTYSFLSLDRGGVGDDHLVAGEYGRKGGSHRLISYAIDGDTGLLRSDGSGRAQPTEMHERQVARMQGAVVADGRWVLTSSNGEGLPGDLWIGRPGRFTRHRGVLPTGPEDITWLPQRRQLWSLTEWPGRRWVYAIEADRWFALRR